MFVSTAGVGMATSEPDAGPRLDRALSVTPGRRRAGRTGRSGSASQVREQSIGGIAAEANAGMSWAANIVIQPRPGRIQMDWPRLFRTPVFSGALGFPVFPVPPCPGWRPRRSRSHRPGKSAGVPRAPSRICPRPTSGLRVRTCRGARRHTVNTVVSGHRRAFFRAGESRFRTRVPRRAEPRPCPRSCSPRERAHSPESGGPWPAFASHPRRVRARAHDATGREPLRRP